MSNKTCRHCEFPVSRYGKTCPRCGAKQPFRYDWLGSLGVFAAVIIIVSFILPEDSNVSQQPAAPKVKMERVTIRFEFETVAQCAQDLNVVIGPLKIVKDSPSEVLGRTREGHLFACTLEETGTRGIYVNGWYVTEQPKNQ